MADLFILLNVVSFELCIESGSRSLCSRVWRVAFQWWNVTYPERSCSRGSFPYPILHVHRYQLLQHCNDFC